MNEVISAAFAEGLRRDPERLRRWVVLVDGNKDQITRVKRAAKKACVEITIVLDIIHVLEYLSISGRPRTASSPTGPRKSSSG